MNKNAKKRENLTYNKLNRIKNKAIKEYYVKNNGELLEFLFENIKGQSKNNIKTILKNNCIGVNGAPVKQFNYPLLKGDVVCVSKYPLEEKIKKDNFKLEIIYEDDDFLVINKPYGLLSISSDKEKSKTAYRYCMDYVRSKDKMARIYVVHRIDKDTSGLLLICKDDYTHKEIAKQLEDHSMHREYIALTDGIIRSDNGKIIGKIGRDKTNRLKMAIDNQNGKEAITHFEVLKRYSNYTLIKCRLETGRTHQIRVHMSSINHPLVGDKLYGGSTSLYNDGQLLHAYKLTFYHPILKKEISLETDLPQYFKEVLDKLKN